MGISGKARLALLGVTVLASVAATGPALAVQRGGESRLSSGDWRLEYQHDRTPQSALWDMDGSGTDNLWAVGYQGSWDEDRPLVVRHDGSGWREVPVPASYGLPRISEVAATATGAWVLTAGTHETVSPPRADSVLLRWTGAGWDRHTFPDTRGGGVDAVADDDVWHAAISAGDGAVARHWDGHSWTRSALPGDPDWISDVTARAHDDVWVTGSKGDRLYLAHWSGDGWREATPPPVTAPPTDPDEDREVYFRDFVAVSPQQRWALITSSSDDVYRTVIYRYGDGGWHEVAGPDLGGGGECGHLPGSLAVDDRGEAWLSTNSDCVFRRVGRRWQKSELAYTGRGFVELDDIAVVGGVARVTGQAVYDDDGEEYDAVIYRVGTPTTESSSPEPTQPTASSSVSAEPSSPATTPVGSGSPSEPPGGLPTTGNRAGLIIGSGIALLLAGAALLWFGRRRWGWRVLARQ